MREFVTGPVKRLGAVGGRHRTMVGGYFETKVPLRKLQRSLSGCTPIRFLGKTGCCSNSHDPGRLRHGSGNCSRT